MSLSEEEQVRPQDHNVPRLADDEAVEAAGPGDTPPLDAPRRFVRGLNRRGLRLVMFADVVALAAIVIGSMLVRFGTDWPEAPVANYLGSFALAILVFVGSLYFGGLYEREPRLGAPPAFPRAGQQTLAAGGLVALLSLGLSGLFRELGIGPQRALPFPILNLATLIALGAPAIAVNRRLAHLVRTRREGPPRVLLVGHEEDLERAKVHLDPDRVPIRITAAHSEVHDLPEKVRQAGATDVLVLSRECLEDLYGEVLEQLERDGVTVGMRVSGRETLFGLERLRQVGGIPFVLLRTQTLPRSRARFKRLLDVSLTIAAAPVWFPLLALTTLYQLTVAGRPLLYWQERVGAGGRTFRMVKFRTMVVDAESATGAQLAEEDDPRVIAACRFIRATRLDELPQLLNVLRGEMSLVGPRPERPELTTDFERSITGYGRRHEVPPGLTGLAQIHGRYHTDAEYKLGYDLQYLVNWSPLLDLQILFRTIWVVLARRI